LTYYFPTITYIYVIVNINGDIMGKVKALWQEGIEKEIDDYVDGIITEDQVSDDAKEQYILSNEDISFKSLNVRVSIYDQIKRIAKEDNRTIAATVAIMVRDTLSDRQGLKTHYRRWIPKGWNIKLYQENGGVDEAK
jgi:hypothetical protein